MTSQDFQRYVRILIYTAATSLATYGIIHYTQAQLEIVLGISAFVANIVWSVYGMQITQKLKDMSELAQDPNVPIKGVILQSNGHGAELAAKVPGPVVVENTVEARRIAA